MSQRIKNCTSTTNLDTINCNSYRSRLCRQTPGIYNQKANGVRSNTQRCSRNRSCSSTSRTAVPVTPPNLKTRPSSLQQRNLASPARSSGHNADGLLHKEVIADNSAMVEVTVRTHKSKKPQPKPSKPPNESDRKPWNDILKTNRQSGWFESFDPLRTLHFLAQELQTKLKASSDPNLAQMLTDMQKALARIPPDVTQTLKQQPKPEVIPKRNPDKLDEIPFQEKLVHVIKPSKSNKSCQTASCSQKLMEQSTSKLEASCKQMEQACWHLKHEKEQLEHLLVTEKETVAFLRKRIEDVEFEEEKRASFAYEQVVAERDELQKRLAELETRLLDSQQGPAVQELVRKFQAYKKESEEELYRVHQKLILAEMKADKYVVMLNYRDRQIGYMDVYHKQMFELRKGFVAATQSGLTSGGSDVQEETDELGGYRVFGDPHSETSTSNFSSTGRKVGPSSAN